MLNAVETLNENQRKAVSWNGGPLLVLAGLGAGKTRALALRIARTLEENADASVLALTNSDKAAADMRERVEQLTGQQVNRARFCTFFSFAADILRQHGSHLGLRPDFRLLIRDEDRIAILENVVAGLPDEGDPLPADRLNLLRFVDRLFAESYDGGKKASSLVRTPTWASALHRDYCMALVCGNSLDFGGLLHFACRLLKEKSAVARVVRLGCTHISVDEFQDTSKAQYDFLRLIAPESRRNLFVAGDANQIIYQLNGANPKRLAQFRQDYHMDIIQFPENYRCPASIIALANRMIAHNAKQVGKMIAPQTSLTEKHHENNSVRYRTFESPEQEAAYIPGDIRRRRLAAADCVVLGRTSRLLEGAVSGLTDAGFEASLVRQKTDFETPVVRVLFEALRLANARHDRDILRRLCVAWSELSARTLEANAVAAAAALSGGDFLRAWADAASATVSDRFRAMVDRIRSDLVDSLAFPEIVDWFLEEGWESWSADNEQRSGDEQGANAHQELADDLKIWRVLHGDMLREYGPGRMTLHAYLRQMYLNSKPPRRTPDAVRCMTVHDSTGLKFNHVYLIGMAQEVFPSVQALRKGAGSREVEEERRNCFMAVTRAERTLTLTRAENYDGCTKTPSQFLYEMGVHSVALQDCRR